MDSYKNFASKWGFLHPAPWFTRYSSGYSSKESATLVGKYGTGLKLWMHIQKIFFFKS